MHYIRKDGFDPAYSIGPSVSGKVSQMDDLDLYRCCSECATKIYYTCSDVNSECDGKVFYPWYDIDDKYQPCCSIECRSALEADYDEEAEEELVKITRDPEILSISEVEIQDMIVRWSEESRY